MADGRQTLSQLKVSAFLSWKFKKMWTKHISGLYYKHILTSVSDDRKWCLYYKCVIEDASLVS